MGGGDNRRGGGGGAGVLEGLGGGVAGQICGGLQGYDEV